MGAISPASAAYLVPRSSQTFTAVYVVTQSDADRGSLSNTATVNGTASNGNTVSDEDSVTIEGQANPAATLTTSSSVTSGMAVSAGDSITYTFTVTNTGNITLETVSVSDSLPGLSAVTPDAVATLAPGESATFTATYMLTQQDIDAGTLADTATASMQTPQSCSACPAPPQPSSTNEIVFPQYQIVQLAVNADPAADVHEGDVITYTFDVTNTGNVTLFDVEVASDLPGLTWVNGPGIAALAPNETATVTAAYTVTANDVASGIVRTIASVTGYPPESCSGCMPAFASAMVDVSVAPAAPPSSTTPDAGEQVG
jgi:uncharacterized repeat protein (TIGR01451 family)